jgi:hypothetical protein
MDYAKLSEMWSIDSDINIHDISEEVKNIPNLHSKYFNIYIEQSMKLKKIETKKLKLYSDKYDYYSGQMDIEDIKERGWKPLQKLILKADVQRIIETDDQIIELNLKIAYLKSVIDYLESIIKIVNNRGYNLKLIFDYERFRNGNT